MEEMVVWRRPAIPTFSVAIGEPRSVFATSRQTARGSTPEQAGGA